MIPFYFSSSSLCSFSISSHAKMPLTTAAPAIFLPFSRRTLFCVDPSDCNNRNCYTLTDFLKQILIPSVLHLLSCLFQNGSASKIICSCSFCCLCLLYRLFAVTPMILSAPRSSLCIFISISDCLIVNFVCMDFFASSTLSLMISGTL